MRFEIGFSGHANIRSLHPSTIEITRDAELTLAGDCVVGVRSKYACADVPDSLKSRLRDSATRVRIGIHVDGMLFEADARGDPAISLTHERDIVIRRSAFVCPRTLAVGCDAASDAIPREMIHSLRDARTRGTLSITV